MKIDKYDDFWDDDEEDEEYSEDDKYEYDDEREYVFFVNNSIDEAMEAYENKKTRHNKLETLLYHALKEAKSQISDDHDYLNY